MHIDNANDGVYIIEDVNEDSIDLFLANSQLTSKETLEALADSKSLPVVEAVAHNKNSAANTLYRLANHNNYHVRSAVAENPYVPFEILDDLCSDNHPDVRYAIAANPRVPKHVLANLLRDDNPYVAKRAYSTLTRLQSEVDPKDSPCVAGLTHKHFGPNDGEVERKGNSWQKIQTQFTKLFSVMLLFTFVGWQTMSDKQTNIPNNYFLSEHNIDFRGSEVVTM